MSLVTDLPAGTETVASTKTVRLAPIAATAVVGLGALLLLLAMSSHLLADPDSQWHIAVGRWIVAHRAVPTTDVFSYTFVGAPWIAKEWVSQLVLLAAFSLGGWNGVAGLTALVLAGVFASLHLWLCRRMRPLVAMTLTVAAFTLCESHMLARPHTMVMPFILAWLMVLIDALERGAAPRIWAALLMVAWVNMHGSFPLGLVMAGVLAGEAVVFAAPAARLRLTAGWALFIALSTAATMLSPFGWSAILVPLKMFGNADTMRFVNEWRPIGFDPLGFIAVAMLVATTALLLLDARRNLFRLLLAGLLAYLMVRHVRFISLFGLTSPLLVARSVGLRMPPVHELRVPPGLRKAVLAAIVVLVPASLGLAVFGRARTAADATPQAAYDVAMAHGLSGHVYNDYDFGGFLIAHGVETFVDGRTDQLFLGTFLGDMDAAMEAKDDKAFIAMLDKADAKWALVRASARNATHLDRLPGWTRLHKDDVAAVYRRD